MIILVYFFWCKNNKDQVSFTQRRKLWRLTLICVAILKVSIPLTTKFRIERTELVLILKSKMRDTECIQSQVSSEPLGFDGIHWWMSRPNKRKQTQFRKMSLFGILLTFTFIRNTWKEVFDLVTLVRISNVFQHAKNLLWARKPSIICVQIILAIFKIK